MKVTQNKSELLDHLNEQLEFLKASAISFDNGFLGEAKRIAVTIRILLHDTKNSKSLLGLLKMKSGFVFFDSSFDLDKKNTISHLGLVGTISSPGKTVYSAFLERKVTGQLNKYVLFPNWWNKSVIKDNNRNAFNRRDLVLTLANKVGGTHVVPKLDGNYVSLTQDNSVGICYFDGNDYKGAKDVELHTLRQMAYEMIVSIEKILNKPNKKLNKDK